MMLARSLALALIAPALVSAAQPQPQLCSPPVALPASVTTPNATYYSTGEPPKRFSGPPNQEMKVTFGQAAIDGLCGRPPCGMQFDGCVHGDRMALPDPFSTDSAQFAKIVRHELAHVNGWPETHGD